MKMTLNEWHGNRKKRDEKVNKTLAFIFFPLSVNVVFMFEMLIMTNVLRT